MVVYKFGGASVSTVESIKNLAGIVRGCNDELIIVVSAFGKTTNSLEELLDSFYNNRSERFGIFRKIVDYHYDIIRGLFPSADSPVYGIFASLTGKIEERIKNGCTGNYDFEYDQLVSFGELISTRVVSEYLNSCGIRNKWTDAREWLITDKTFREANVDFAKTGSGINDFFISPGYRIYITQGFIGGTTDGFSTTLGREGSDYTAAIIANLLNTEKMIVWKDVPGILTADPAYFPDAEKLDVISYHEAIELSFYGAKVIHPKTIKPLQNKSIPLYVKSFVHPEAAGTLIHDIDKAAGLKPVLIIKQDQMLVSLIPVDFSFVVEDCLSRIFALFFKHRMKINLIQHSAISFTLCFDNKGPYIREVLQSMRKEFRVLYNEGLELVTIRHYTSAAIEKHTLGRQVLVEQRSRATAMFVVR